MTLKSILSAAILISLAHTAAFSQGRPATNIPHLEKRGTATQLIVDGKPFLVLGAELNDSSASSLEYMRPLWPKIADRGALSRSPFRLRTRMGFGPDL